MVDTIKFSQMTDAGNINNNDIMPTLRSGENVIVNNPWTFLPPGTTAQRPTPSVTVNFRLRFNTEDQLYEYYDSVLAQWTQLQESAFTQGPFISYTASASLPDAQNLGLLADGILFQTVAAGIATLDVLPIPLTGAKGGTGVDNGILTINLGSATTGYVLTSDASGNATWQAVSSAGSITQIDGDSGSATPTAGVVTLTGASTGLTFTGSGSTLTLGGILLPINGGTGVASPTAHGILVGEGASPVTPIVLSDGQILIGSTGLDPVAAAIGSGTGILVGNGAGSISVALAPVTTLTGLVNLTGGAAAPTPHTLSEWMDSALGSTRGQVIYRNATIWTVLNPGTNGQVLATGGAGADPSWVTNGNGTVTSIATNDGITGGTITTTGTIGLAAIADNTLLANVSGGALAPSATTLTTLIDEAIGNTQGNILYRNATSWVALAPGSAGQQLTSGGAGANVSWSAGSSGTLSVVQQIFTASGTYTPTTGMAYCIIEAVGGGGGSGATVSASGANSAASGAGGAAGYSKGVYTLSQIKGAGTVAAITVGTGGAGGAAGSNSGTPGNATTVIANNGAGATLMTCNGGNGGSFMTSTSGSDRTNGGAGGTASGGSLNVTGNAGSPGIVASGTAIPGYGGSSYYGGVSRVSVNQAGVAATGYGSGGTGVWDQGVGTDLAGGAGSDGVVYITEFVLT
jgi:hypothetical protein